MFMTNQSYKRQKQSSALSMAARCRLGNEGQNEQQQQQPANHIPDNRDLKQTDAAAERRRSTSKSPFRRTQGQ